jgi:uncharacterized protein YndB with AHSA1/START domain
MGSRTTWFLLLAALPSYPALAQRFEYFDKPVQPETPVHHPDNPLQRPSVPLRQYEEGAIFIGSTIENLRGMNLAAGARTLTLVDGRRVIVSEPASPLLPGTPLVHEAVVAAPVDDVWRAWSTSTGLSAWLAPQAAIDLRIGGSLRVSYDGSGIASDTAVVNEILAFDPRRMLAFRVTKAPTDFQFATAVATMWTVVYFEPVGDSATRVRVVVNGLGSDATEARAFFESGNAQTLQRLVERFGAP